MSHHNQRGFRARKNARDGYAGGQGDQQKRGPCRRSPKGSHQFRRAAKLKGNTVLRCARCGLPREIFTRRVMG